MTSVLSADHFHDEEAAYRFVEARLWADGRVCPHCGTVDNSGALKGKSTRIGVYKCYSAGCRKPFTVKVGTIFEASHVKLHIWLQAIHLMASSKKGFSANQFARTLGVTLKSAWFLAHRIREAMRSDDLVPFGLGGGVVESDETFLFQNPHAPRSRTPIRNMNAIMTMVDRDTGRARSVVIDELNSATVGQILAENLSAEARLMTDEARHYMPPGRQYADHKSVAHAADEYVSRQDPTIHTNTVENYYSVFKRGMKGTYQHAARRHLHRYCAEFDFRYSNRVALGVDDVTRADRILAGVKGRRLTYRTTRPGRTVADAS
jgi:transposase-like protein